MGESANSRDIKVERLQNLDWSPEGAMGSLDKAANYACDYASQAVDWYLRFKAANRVRARRLRFSAILFAAAAGILPMIQQVCVTKEGLTPIPPVCASILLAVAVFFVALDRFFGFSSGYIRYVLAEAQIRRVMQDFELDWQARLASYAGQPPTTEQIQHALATIKAFVAQVNTVIGDETLKWVVEFQEALKQVDEQVRATPAAVQTGSLALTVTNGDAVDASGWTLAVDQGRERTYTGKTAAIAGLMPGDHVVHLAGTADGRPLQASLIATIRPGTSTALDVTLA